MKPGNSGGSIIIRSYPPLSRQKNKGLKALDADQSLKQNLLSLG
jgi:hypothetical protein